MGGEGELGCGVGVGWPAQSLGIAAPPLLLTALCIPLSCPPHLQLELNNRNIIVHLTHAIARGAPTGQTGHLDLAATDTAALSWAVEYASRLGAVTAVAEQLLATAQAREGERRLRLST